MEQDRSKAPIDFVIAWVDESDSEWIAQRIQYELNSEYDIREIRYRDFDNLQYLFRGIETFAPWVRYVHFVTWGHVPKWLDRNHPKLRIVKHEDFIEEKYLPLFDSGAIEMHLHKIPDLAEQFVYFNDDMFLLKPTQPTDFFGKGLPCSTFILEPICPEGVTDVFNFSMFRILAIVNAHFDKKRIQKRDIGIWLNPRWGIKPVVKNVLCLTYRRFPGILYPHLPASFLRETFIHVWEAEPELAEMAGRTKFRSKESLSQYLFQAWQMLTGRFSPRKYRIGKWYQLDKDLDKAIQAITKQSCQMICLNDGELSENFESVKKQIQEAFELILPEKSRFEK